MRVVVLAAVLAAGCAELGVIGDNTSVSVGKPSNGRIIDAARIPDRGEGFVTREVWRSRNQRYGTDELIDLITGVSRRMIGEVKDVRIVVADLSGRIGGEAHAWHRSHQSGRDVDLVFYMRDRTGKAVEPDGMHVFDNDGVARDGTGLTVDVPRTWRLVRELITAPEASVQWVFMYEPIAAKLIAHATEIREPEALVARARTALRQPGDSARHDDHLHVRVYCSVEDRAYGCIDLGPMELQHERDQEMAAIGGAVVAALAGALPAPASDSRAPTVSIADLRRLGRRWRSQLELRAR